MLLKGCLHTHTTCSDGELSPQEAAAAYEAKGYDFIAFTDHDHLLKKNYLDLYRQVKTDMIIFYGIELTVFVNGYVHVGKIAGDQEELHIFNHIGEYDFTPEQLLARLAELEKLYPLDAVEITKKGFRDRVFEALAIAYPKIASDDSHTAAGIGRAWVELDAKREKDAIIKSVKKGEFWNCYLH
ncbi:MAG: PHP domain-containing protein [Syntrophobacterales bacterium]|nr:PHP domain-containing protein [Syntrophobacterales bacterium]